MTNVRIVEQTDNYFPATYGDIPGGVVLRSTFSKGATSHDIAYEVMLDAESALPLEGSADDRWIEVETALDDMLWEMSRQGGSYPSTKAFHKAAYREVVYRGTEHEEEIFCLFIEIKDDRLF